MVSFYKIWKKITHLYLQKVYTLNRYNFSIFIYYKETNNNNNNNDLLEKYRGTKNCICKD